MYRKIYKIKTPQICQMLGVTRMTLYTWEQQGKFTPPRTGTRGNRMFTIWQAKQICQAFAPGGCRYWHFNPSIAKSDVL